MTASAMAPAGPMPQARLDTRPLALLGALALIALPLIGSPSTWATLTVAGLAMGLIIFVIASGLTLVFGLMDVLNFGHGYWLHFELTSVLLLAAVVAAIAVIRTGRRRDG